MSPMVKPVTVSLNWTVTGMWVRWRLVGSVVPEVWLPLGAVVS